MSGFLYAEQEREMEHIVYAPTIGYRVHDDTGRRFALESEATNYVIKLRRSGVFSWVEVDEVTS